MIRGAARLGDMVIGTDFHGKPCCTPHRVIGKSATITMGSLNVFINGRPAVRMMDKGMHMACCGLNIFTHLQGSTNVFVNSRPLVRRTDITKHCGGIGKVIMASTNVLVNSGGGAAGVSGDLGTVAPGSSTTVSAGQSVSF